jgi:non-heme Fe2+,alpha-ketoglutarate-dependent halogenase
MGFKEFWARRHERRARIRTDTERRIKAMVLFFLFFLKPFRFLYPLLPKPLRTIAKFWNYKMLGTYVFSAGKRILADQPSMPRVPASYAPRAEVDEQYRLSEEQIRSFWDNGFLGPIQVCSEEEMAEFEKQLRLPLSTVSAFYGIQTGRDRHLDCPVVLRMAHLTAIKETVAQFLGPDLLLWRTQLIPKAPGAAETAWHQVSTFTMSSKALRPVLEPPDINDLFNVTVWLAVDSVDVGNGCMQFWRGSHRKPLHTLRLDQGQQFGRSTFQLEANIPPEEVADMELRAGECVLFHERTVHGARPNVSTTRRRFGMNFRICRPDVYVYRGVTREEGFTFEENYDIAKWGVILLRGEDRYHRNRYAQPLTEPSQPAPSAEPREVLQYR